MENVTDAVAEAIMKLSEPKADACARKLVYFPLRGKGELPRLTLLAAGYEFDDKAIEINCETVAKIAEMNLPYPHLPVYYEKDFLLCQSHAITNYIARSAGLYGKSEMEICKIEELVEGWREVQDALCLAIQCGTSNRECVAANINKTLFFINRLLAANFEVFGFSVGSSLTVADLHVLDKVDNILAPFFPEVLQRYPIFLKIRNKVAQTKGIAEYISERRPKDILPPVCKKLLECTVKAV